MNHRTRARCWIAGVYRAQQQSVRRTRQGRARREGRVESLSGRNATSGDPLENAIGKGDLGSQISKGGEDVSVWGGNLISLPRQTR